ncbi:hypothetical protein DPSP01_009525 [Paraphaeosphaeria sporulosa]
MQATIRWIVERAGKYCHIKTDGMEQALSNTYGGGGVTHGLELAAIGVRLRAAGFGTEAHVVLSWGKTGNCTTIG